VLYSDDPSKNTDRYLEIFRVEYMLSRLQLTLESKIENKRMKIEEMLHRTKECMRNNNKATAKEYIKDVEVEKEAMGKLMLRKRMLVRQSNQL